MRISNELTGDPKCWLCASVVLPGKVYAPNICDVCLPKYKERKFVFVRHSQAELDELFPIVIRQIEKASIIRSEEKEGIS